MVLCRFFQQGNCRFGSKCHNEHFDVKQILKADVDAALNGKQWPFSCYSPFKDKPCLPNFAEDRSFEEIRFLCYEAKRQNCFEQFHQQFSKEAIEITNKMKAMYQSPGIIEAAINLYDTPSQSKTVTPANNNPFMAANNTVAAPSNGGSLFSKPAVNAGNVNPGSIFGGGTLNTGNVFGQVAQQQSNSIFGQQQQTAQTSIFGQQQHLQPEQQNTGNIFAQATQQNTVGGGNIFAQAAQQTSFGLFGQAAQQQTPAAFTQQVTNQNPFVQPNHAIGAGANLFGQSVAAPGNIFTQTALQQQAPPSGLFASAAAQAPATFMQQQQQQQQQAPLAFGVNTLNHAAAMQQPPQMQPPQIGATQNIDYSIYSKMEDLTAEEIEAFKAPEFLPGKVPFSPPPFELIN